MIGGDENEGCKPDPIMRKMASGLQPSNVISIIFPRACALGWYGAAPLALKDKKRPPEQLPFEYLYRLIQIVPPPGEDTGPTRDVCKPGIPQ